MENIENNLLFYGTKLKYRVPDAHMHENTIRKFMLIADRALSTLSIIYFGNDDCTCKDGWTKFTTIPTSPGALATTKELLIEYLTKYYTNKDGICEFDKNTFEIIVKA